MKRGALIAIFFCVNILVYSSNQLDSLLNVLDKTVALRHTYNEQKETTIANLKLQLADASVDKQRYNIYSKLFELYKNYQTDSAYHIALAKVKLADKMGDRLEIAQSRMNLTEIYRTTGMYKETLEMLSDLRQNDLGKEDLGYFYHLYHSLYILMADYAISDEEKKMYNGLIFNYKDSIINLLEPDEIHYVLVQSTKEILLGEFDAALKLAKEGFAKSGTDSPLLTYTLSEIYHNLGDVQEEKKYLAMSAIVDLKSGVKEYISLRKLAVLLYNEGDIDRAYSYIQCAMEDAIFSNSRLRTLEIARMLPIVNETYDLKMKQERERLSTLLVITIILALVLLCISFYTYKQVKALSSIRKYQKKMNTELKAVNEELQQINTELSDSNLVKEEYIGYVFKICSSYIDKLEDFRVNVNRKIKTGQIKELEKITSSPSLVADELKEFYKNFDTIFLNIYPSFIEEFNALLTDEGKIYPKDGDLLTPELRIFALVRLGINDSVKIADFLHYSPQTIYNYRLKVRNKSIVPKGDFSTEMGKIGLSLIDAVSPINNK